MMNYSAKSHHKRNKNAKTKVYTPLNVRRKVKKCKFLILVGDAKTVLFKMGLVYCGKANPMKDVVPSTASRQTLSQSV